MQIPNKLEEPFRYSWKLVTVLLVIVSIIVIIVLFRKFLWDRLFRKFKKIYDEKKVPNLKVKYLKKLERLLIEVEKGNIKVREAYIELSNIIRDFIEKVSGINVSSMSKKEVSKKGIKPLDMLMDEYYPPEFSKYSKGDIINSIKRTMEVIKRWN